MELWWWLEPLAETGLVCAALAIVIGLLFHDSDNTVAMWIVLALLVPIALTALSIITWLTCSVFHAIWSPYF